MRLSIRVQPKASHNRIQIATDGSIRVYVTAPPADGAANRAVCEFLAGVFSLPKSAVRVDSGERSRDKIVELTGISRETVESRLETITQSAR